MVEAKEYPIERNPFYVLELGVAASRMEVERQGQKLLAMLELHIESAQRYRTPLGVRPRDADLVREALAELRDPRRRLVHELWHVGDELIDLGRDARAAPEASDSGWRGALAAHGWVRK